ncbi:MAG: hypothetical protein HY042_10860, partial [Spirochaetia bacterium]|nr:hypothetical protein [Spirochaetia bacterium]
MKVKKQTAILLGAAGLVLIVLIWFALRSPSTDRTREQQDMSSTKEPGVRMGDDGIPVIEDDPKSVLERYKKWAVYPPHSRPLYAGQVDLTQPYTLPRTPVGVIEKPAQGCEKAADGSMKCSKPPVMSEVVCTMQPERSISVGKKDFHITLRCVNPKQGVNLPIDSIESKVYHVPLKEVIPSLPPISAADDGQNGDEKAGDKIYTFTVRPGAADWGPMYLEVSFTVQGMKHVQRTDWYSTPQNVAEFQQGIRDANRNGHLIVSVPVTVYKDGYYLFEANLVQKGE